MQKSLSELTSLPPHELSRLIDGIGEPLLVTWCGEPKFVAQSLEGFEAMVRRLRAFESKEVGQNRHDQLSRRQDANDRPRKFGIVVPLRP